jgi:RND superfamily putative drug exporter
MSANQAAVERVVAQLKAAPKVANVVDPFLTKAISPDGRVALVQVSYMVKAPEITTADRHALTASEAVGRLAGLEVEFGGDAIQGMPATSATEGSPRRAGTQRTR